MKILNLARRVGRYGMVGITSATIHAFTLLACSQVLPLWLSNLFGFFAASIVSYLGHALFTFRHETLGKRFARRWLIIQFLVNMSISALLPIVLSRWADSNLTTMIFIFTPTSINALIWNKAAKFSLKRQMINHSLPNLHADDFGLSDATNTAIIDLAKSGKLDSASLIVNGTAVSSALESWKNDLSIPLSLHICLTEGPTLSKQHEVTDLTTKNGTLNASFSKLLLISILPKNSILRRNIKQQIHNELIAQISRFKELTGMTSVRVDGHQYIHLVPIVLEVILELAKTTKIKWVRTASEPLPSGISLRCLLIILSENRWLKWIILQFLTLIAKPKIKNARLRTNKGFSGVLFTGKMSNSNLKSAWNELKMLSPGGLETEPIVLSHPGAKPESEIFNAALSKFTLSIDFMSSRGRQMEWDALKKFNPPTKEEYN